MDELIEGSLQMDAIVSQISSGETARPDHSGKNITEVGSLIEAAVRAAGLDERDVANDIGIPIPRFRAICKGEAQGVIRSEELERIAVLCKCPVPYLRGEAHYDGTPLENGEEPNEPLLLHVEGDPAVGQRLMELLGRLGEQVPYSRALIRITGGVIPSLKNMEEVQEVFSGARHVPIPAFRALVEALQRDASTKGLEIDCEGYLFGRTAISVEMTESEGSTSRDEKTFAWSGEESPRTALDDEDDERTEGDDEEDDAPSSPNASDNSSAQAEQNIGQTEEPTQHFDKKPIVSGSIVHRNVVGLREAFGFSNSELGKRVDPTKPWSAATAGQLVGSLKQSPNVRRPRVEKFAKAFGVEPEWLCETHTDEKIGAKAAEIRSDGERNVTESASPEVQTEAVPDIPAEREPKEARQAETPKPAKSSADKQPLDLSLLAELEPEEHAAFGVMIRQLKSMDAERRKMLLRLLGAASRQNQEDPK